MLRDLPTTKLLSVAAYARVLIPELFLDSVERVLYLDADCIVVGDLTALWQFDMGNAAIAAVPDQMERGFALDKESDINAGVMLMNLAIWRRERLASVAGFRQESPSFLVRSAKHQCRLRWEDRLSPGTVEFFVKQARSS